MPRTVYIVNGSSPARAALMACKAVGLDVNVYKMKIQTHEEHLEDWFVKLNPWHKVPTFDDEGFVISESRTILRYVVNAYAPGSDLYPSDPKQRALVDRMLDYDLDTLYKIVGYNTYPEVFLFHAPHDRSDICKELQFLESKTGLASHNYVVGDHMTIADISMIASLSFLEIIDFDFSPYPKVCQWMERMKALPYYEECNEGLEVLKTEIKTDEWKRDIHAWMTKMGRPIGSLEEALKKK